jgi:hypothetical protein
MVLGLSEGRLLARLLINRTLCTGDVIVGLANVSPCTEYVSWSHFSDHAYVVTVLYQMLSLMVKWPILHVLVV